MIAQLDAYRDGELAEVIPYLHSKADVRGLIGSQRNACAMPVSGDALAQVLRGTEKTEQQRAKRRAAIAEANRRERTQPTLFDMGVIA